MKRVLHTKYGPPEVLKVIDVQKPTPGKNQILIKVYATTVNRTDCAMFRAKPAIMRLVTGLFKPRKTTPGTDFAGTIEEVGENVAKYKKGDNIFGFYDMVLGSQAEYFVLDQKIASGKIPENLNFEQAAASIEGAHYAYNFINKIDLRENHTVLVNGATGAIGSACVQMLKYLGAEVTAVCKGEHAEMIKKLGAIDVIDYTSDDFTKLNIQFDYVFDAVGKSSFKKCKPILKPNGVYISSELGAWSQNIFYSLFTPLFCKKKVKFPFPGNIQASVDLVSELCCSGHFCPLIDRKFELNEIAEAYTYVESGEKIGNVILNM